jgi:AraC family transcriptional activator of tynA and feaB
MRVDRFSTGNLPFGARSLVWREAMGRLAAVDFGTRPLGAKPFDAELTAYRGRRLRFSAYRFSAHVSTYRPDAGTARVDRHFILAHVTEGGAIVAQDGRETSVGAGDIVLVDAHRPLRIESHAMRVHSVDVCGERMRTAFPQVGGLTAIALKDDRGPVSILRGMVDELFRSGATLGDAVGDRIADAIPHLIAAALASLPEADRAVPTRLEAYHRERIREFVRDNLRDPELAPEIIARAVGLSPRRVHELFGTGPMTLMRWIWAQRLERCREELAMPSLRQRSIGEIAYGWGFSDQAHFSRAFRAGFGRSPRNYRQQAF